MSASAQKRTLLSEVAIKPSDVGAKVEIVLAGFFFLSQNRRYQKGSSQDLFQSRICFGYLRTNFFQMFEKQ
jgi:hypothetical protein